MPRSRSLLGLPAWTWPLVSFGLILAAGLVPPPGPMAEPSQVSALFRNPVLVTRSEGVRVIPYGKHQGIGPVWALGLRSEHHTTVDRNFGMPANGETGLGFWHRRDRWRYDLTAVRYDAEARSAAPGSLWLPDREAEALRPVAVAELDRRSGGIQGTQLASLLERGAQQESWVCPQNALVLAAWISIPLACWGVVRTIHARLRRDVKGKSVAME